MSTEAMVQPAHVLIVEAPYYADVAEELLSGTTAELEAHGVTYERLQVPGAFEIPAAIAFACANQDRSYDGYIALGCVIRGETTHYDYICGESARGLMDLAVRDHVALGYGILTVENKEQAMARASVAQKNKGRDAAQAALRMIELKRKFRAVSAS